MASPRVGTQAVADGLVVSSGPHKCEVRVRLQLFRGLRWPYIRTPECGKPATHCALNMCCGSKTLVCRAHYDLVQRTLPVNKATLTCGECGAKVIPIWSVIE